MPGPDARIRAFLADLGARWRRLAWLRYGARVGLILGAIWAVAIAVWLVGARASLAREAWLVAAVAVLTAVVCTLAWRRQPMAPAGVVLARLAEERVPALDDCLVTAAGIVDGDTEASPAIRSALLADTAARLDQLQPDAVISGERMRRGAWQAAAVAGILLVTGTTLIGPTLRTAQAAWVFASPNALAFHVDPGNVRIRPNTPLVIRVQASSGIGDLVPSLVAKIADATREERMTREEANRFSATFATVPASFSYHIALAGRTSPDFQVTLLQPPRVGRIDLSYEFPSYAKLPPRSETDGGDVYAPEGTRVHMVVHPREATAHVASAELALGGDKRVPLAATPDGTLAGDLVVSSDDTYRVRLTDTDGLQNTDDPEYFVRVLDDRPPEVHIVRPAGDRQVTPLEEVEIEARADDDHGVDRLELVYGVKGRGEKVVPLGGDGASLTVTGHYTIPLEQLEISPGDFVTFYARARDIARGKRPSEARSDIFFLEVTPFVDEFALAQSQAMAGAAGQQMDDLVRLQKDIIVGTWKVDRRSAGPRAEASPEAVRTLAKGQATVRQKTVAAAGRAGGGGPMHASPDESSASIGGHLMAAAGSMANAESALGGQKTAAALPFEMDALNHLLKAQSEAARKEVMRQQAGGAGGSSRAQQDLSSLFDRELQKQQQTNYEMPKTAEEKRDESTDQTLDRVRDLARRQEALSRQQDDLSRDRQRLDEEEVRRRLERLTREQSDLRREAELLAEQLRQDARRQEQASRQPQNGQRGQAQQSTASDAKSQAATLQQASEDMRGAASQLRREDPASARGQSDRALQKLRGVERALSESGPDERRKALGDTQLEARQLATRQRQLNEQAARASEPDRADARRRVSGEQEQLAGRADALAQRLRELSSRGGDKAEQGQTAAASRAFDGEKVPEKMREIARRLQDDGSATTPGAGQQIARSLDRLADRVGGSAAGHDREGQELGENLAKARDLRERLAELERQIAEQSQRSSSAKSESASGTPSADGTKPGERDRDEAAKLADLRKQYLDALREASGDERMREAVAGTSGAGSTPVGQAMVTAAPGTEAFKQDFARWESLHREVMLGLERYEASLSRRTVDKAARERLRSGGADATPPEYASSVERYFRALAAEPR
jgi:hypothetical protein